MRERIRSIVKESVDLCRRPWAFPPERVDLSARQEQHQDEEPRPYAVVAEGPQSLHLAPAKKEHQQHGRAVGRKPRHYPPKRATSRVRAVPNSRSLGVLIM